MNSVGDSRRYVIVGNGFAGTTAAEQLRKHDPSCSITLFTDEPYTLYNRIALPPLLRKQVAEQKVIMRDVAWHEKQQIELHLETRVDRVVPNERIIVAAGKSYPFDALLIATGGRPNPHPAGGSDGANVYNFQYMTDTLAISHELESAKVCRFDWRLVHRVRAGGSVRLSKNANALGDAWPSGSAPDAR